MAANEVHVSDIGTVFEVTIKDDTVAVDVSTASTKNLLFRKPDGTILTKAASFKTTGADGIIQYVTISGDLSMPGLWNLQAHIVMSSGNWKSDVATFEVHPNLA